MVIDYLSSDIVVIVNGINIHTLNNNIYIIILIQKTQDKES